MNKQPLITCATYITLLRMILVLPLAYALLNNYFLISCVLATVAAFTDLLDGYIARKYHQESPLGALLDPLADKIFILSIFTVLWYEYAPGVPTWFIIFLWTKEILLAVAAGIGIAHGSKLFPARTSGKVAMTLQTVYMLVICYVRYRTLRISLCLSTGMLVAVTMATLYAAGDYAKVGYNRLKKL